MNNKYITIGFWHLRELPGIQYTHLQQVPYSVETMNEIINNVISNNCSVMIRPFNMDNEMVIWIDNGRFGQK